MKVKSSEYKLLPADLPLLQSWLNFLGDFGSGMPANGKDAVVFFNTLFNSLQSQAGNREVKQMIAILFNGLATQREGASMTVLWTYLNYCSTSTNFPDPKSYLYISKTSWEGYWHAFKNGFFVIYFGGTIGENTRTFPPGITFPGNHPALADEMKAVIANWGDKPNNNDVNIGVNINQASVVIEFTQKRMNAWLDTETPIKNAEKVQKDIITRLLTAPAHDIDAYLLILHMLIGLCTSNLQDQQFAFKIVNQPTSSDEHPNDTFINHVMYLVLMYMIDPRGDYGFNNSQLQTVLRDLSAIIKSTDQASVAIKTSIGFNIKMLNSDPSFPIHDPDNPDIKFNTRKSDTLQALEEAREKIKAKLT